MATWSGTLAPYREFARIGFVNVLAFRLRYYTGIITYLLNVTVYYYIWTAVLGAGAKTGMTVAGYNLAQSGDVSVGWIIRSFIGIRSTRRWLTRSSRQDRHGTDQAVSVQGMWLAQAAGDRRFE